MKTILVDDELLAMQDFERQCDAIPEIEIIGKFEKAAEALEFARNHRVEFALLDVEMPGMSGMVLGKKLKEIYPDMILIYLTGYSEYVLEALRIKADYFIMKPCNIEDIKDALSRAILLSGRQQRLTEINAFGRFNVKVNKNTIHFTNSKAKEMFAVLVDRKGEEVSMESMIDILWPDRPYDDKVKKLYRKAVNYLQSILQENEISDVISFNRGSLCIHTKSVKCDYFDFLKDPNANEDLFHGEYMSDYSWSEERIGELTFKTSKPKT